jgi:hypothetical protein
VIVVLVITNSTSALMRSVPANVVGAFAAGGTSIERSIKRSVERNARLYNAFTKIAGKDDPFYIKALALKSLSDSTASYVHNVRSKLISGADGSPKEQADSTSIVQVRENTNTDVVNRILVGNEIALNRGRYSGYEIRNNLLQYCDTIVDLIESENKEFIRSGMNFDLADDYIDDNGDHLDWAWGQFYNAPLVSALTTLLNMENEVRNAETQVLSDLLNSAGKASGEAGTKIAELGQKLEKEQREKEILVLQKDKELNDLKVTAKNAEIQERDQMITVFAIGIIICCFLLFFIIRSNLIRKKINKELASQKKIIEEQKHEVEEKQREIIDSIKYAKRIQSALITSEKYIERIILQKNQKK